MVCKIDNYYARVYRIAILIPHIYCTRVDVCGVCTCVCLARYRVAHTCAHVCVGVYISLAITTTGDDECGVCVGGM